MGNYEQLKQSVSNVIKTNGNQEITGSILQNVLLTIISTVGANATFAGIATPATNPGTPDGPVFYLASESGVYTNFNAIELQDGLSVLSWNGSWSSEQIFGIDDVPTAGSDNLVKSGGVYKELNNIVSYANSTIAVEQAIVGKVLILLQGGSVEVADNATYSISKEISIKAGESILLECTSASGTCVISEKLTDSYSAIVVDTGGATPTEKKYEWLADKDYDNIVLCFKNVSSYTAIKKSVDGGVTKILLDTLSQELEDSISDIEGEISGQNVRNDIQLTNDLAGYMIFNGVFEQSANYNITGTFTLPKGATLHLLTECVAGITVLAQQVVRASSYNLLVTEDSGSSAHIKEFVYTNNTGDDLKNLVICCRVSYTPTAYYIVFQDGLEQRVELIESEVNEKTETREQSITEHYNGVQLIGANATINANVNYSIGEPFSISKGETISLTCWASNTICIIAEEITPNSDYNALRLASEAPDIPAQYTFEWTADKDYNNIVVCYRSTSGGATAVITKYTPSIEARVESLENTNSSLGSIINKYKGKKISILGDSISTFGTPDSRNKDGKYCYSYYPQETCRYSEDGDVTEEGVTYHSIKFDVQNTYWMKLINHLEAVLGINESWRGTAITGNIYHNEFNNQTRINHLGGNGTPDVILIFGGTNDINFAVPLGTVNTDDPSNYTDEQIAVLPVSTFADACRAMLIRIMKTYPNAEVIVLLPTFTVSYYPIANLDSYIEIYKEVCDLFGIRYIDLRTTKINCFNKAAYLVPDGIHPNAAGMALLEDLVYRKMLFE